MQPALSSASGAFAFDEVGAHRVIARMDPANTASGRVAERGGLVVHDRGGQVAEQAMGHWGRTIHYWASRLRATVDNARRTSGRRSSMIARM